MATLPEQLERLEASVHARRRRSCTGRATAPRRTRSSPAIARGARRARGDQGQVAGHRRDRPQRGARGARASSAIETDLAELIIQLARRLVVAHPRARRSTATGPRSARCSSARSRRARTLGDEAPGARRGRAARTCARSSCRCRWRSRGANFGDRRDRHDRASSSPRATGACARRCREVLVTVMGIEKVLPEWRDLEVFLQLLPRSSTAERMNPYTSLWTGVRAGDGPQEFHLVLLDNGRTDVLADEVGRQALHCIRCSACLNVCPVYARDRRPGLRVGLSRARSARSSRRSCAGWTRRRRCRGPRRCAAPATRSARSRSTSRACSSTCAGASCARRSRKLDARGAGDGGGRRASFARAGATRRAQRLARLGRGPLGGLAARARAGALDARCASCPRCPAPDLPRLVARARASDRTRRRARAARDAALRGPRRSATVAGRRPSVPRDYRGAGALGGRPARRRRALLRARGRLPRDGPPRARAATSRTRWPSACRARGARAARGPGRAPVARRRASSSSPTTRRSAPRELDALDGVLTGCALAIAETGTIVLDGGAALGPARADARARPPPLRRRGGADRRRRCPTPSPRSRRRPPRGGRSRSSPARRRLGHRARPRRGRARPAHARRVRRGGLTVDFGISIFLTDETPSPGELARLVEERGLRRRCSSPSTRTSRPARLAVPRRRAAALLPHARPVRRPDGGGRDDETLRLGTGICLVIERDPITTAKEVASLDHLSGGRVEFGVGAGWNREEMREPRHADPTRASALMRERVEAMKAIWTQDEASYHGEHVDFDPIWSWPKPVQKPHPPVLDRRQRREGARPRAALRRRLDPEPRRATSPSASPSCAAAARRPGAGGSRSRTSARRSTPRPSSGWPGGRRPGPVHAPVGRCR